MIQPFPPKLHLWILLFWEPNTLVAVYFWACSLTSFFSIWMPFIAFSYLLLWIELAILCQIQVIKWPSVSFSSVNTFPFRMLAMGFVKIGGSYVVNSTPWVEFLPRGIDFWQMLFHLSIKIITLWLLSFISRDGVTYICVNHSCTSEWIPLSRWIIFVNMPLNFALY